MTLIELIAVIAIVGVLSAIAIPSFVGTTQKFRAIGEISSFTGALALARSQAIKQGARVTICASADGLTCSHQNAWHQGWIIFHDPDGTQTATSPFKVQSTWKNTDVLTANPATPSITFSRDGFLAPEAGLTNVTLTLRTTPANPTALHCVILSRTGRWQVKTQTPATCT